MHELPPGSPGYWGECLTAAALLHLPSTSLACCQCHFTISALCSDHRNYFLSFIPSHPVFLSLFDNPLLFSLPLSLSFCPKHFFWLPPNPCPHLHLLLLSLWLSAPIVFPTRPFSTTFLPICSPSLHLLARPLCYSAGWGVGAHSLNEFQCRLFMKWGCISLCAHAPNRLPDSFFKNKAVSL